jgi:hypothetical protein
VAARDNKHETRLDVCLLDLAATLRESERCAKTIERHLTLVPAIPVPAPIALADRTLNALASSRGLIDEARTLVQAILDGRQLLRQLQAECEKLRNST